jgi:asparagine synthase (glutamine-hydrolysing)
MCGITGLYNSNGLDREADITLRRMVSSLSHRGPDESGIYLDNNAALGHARLSILDPKGGSQPLTNEDSSIWITFNGEIFNYPELRTKLLQSGHNFKTHTDTEVILHLFEEKRERCLEDLNGQFAFAIWDSNTEELFLARDRVGIVPLFYSFTPDGKFIFGSEVKAILSEGSLNRAISMKALQQVFTFWTTLPGYSFFEDVHELPPAHYLIVRNGTVHIKKYWDMRFEDTSPEINYHVPGLVEEIRDLLTDAVKIRLRADVPVGSYLSGGLDSTGLTSVIKNKFDNDLRTFGITFEEAAFNEQYYQQVVVSYLKVKHTEEFVTNNDISDLFTTAVYNMEKPVLRTAPVPLYKLSKRVREEGYKVVLSGEGADEIFGGYNIFKEALVRKFWSMYPGSAKRHLLLSRLYPYVFKNKRLQSSLTDFFRTGIEDPSNPFFSHQIRWKNTSKILSFFSPDLNGTVSSYNPMNDLPDLIPEGFDKWSILGKAQYLESMLFMSGYLLSSQGDRMAMANAVELRVPYLDHRIIEYMAKIPYSLKIRGLNEKFLLKKVFENTIPRQIANRPKNPYRAPVNYLFSNERNNNLDLVSPDSIKEAGLFDPGKVQHLVKKLNGISVGEVDNMAAAGILSSQALYYRFIKEFDGHKSTPDNVTNVYDYRKKLEKSL